MFIAVYRWTVKPGMEDRFVRAWHRGTLSITKIYGSYGSRMHRNETGDFVGYAQWPSRASWEVAEQAHFKHDDAEAAHDFRDSIADHGTILLMEVLDDLLVPPSPHAPVLQDPP